MYSVKTEMSKSFDNFTSAIVSSVKSFNHFFLEMDNKCDEYEPF